MKPWTGADPREERAPCAIRSPGALGRSIPWCCHGSASSCTRPTRSALARGSASERGGPWRSRRAWQRRGRASRASGLAAR